MLSVLTKKFPLSDIVILSPKRLDHSVVFGIDNYKISDSREEGAIFFSTIQAFKGLESKIVVLCDISDVSTEKARQYLYIGMNAGKKRVVYQYLETRVSADSGGKRSMKIPEKCFSTAKEYQCNPAEFVRGTRCDDQWKKSGRCGLMRTGVAGRNCELCIPRSLK